jgi:hypothetical protein
MSVMLVIYMITSVLMSGVAGAVYSLFARAGGMNGEQILRSIKSGMGGDSSFFMIHSLFIAAGTVISTILIWKLFEKRPVREMGLTFSRKEFGRFLEGLCTGAASIYAVAAVLLLTGDIHLEKSSSSGILFRLFSGLFIFTCVALSEEIFSRGFCISVFRQTGSLPVMLLVPSAVFALLHTGNANISLLGVLNIFLVGILLSVQFLKTGSLWMPVGFHLSWNYFQGTILGFNVSGSGQTGVYSIKPVGDSLMNGGAFGPEGGLAVTIVVALGIAVYSWKYRNTKGSALPDKK